MPQQAYAATSVTVSVTRSSTAIPTPPPNSESTPPLGSTPSRTASSESAPHVWKDRWAMPTLRRSKSSDLALSGIEWPLSRKKRDFRVDLAQGHFTTDRHEWQKLLHTIELGQEPFVSLPGETLHAHTILGDEHIFF